MFAPQEPAHLLAAAVPAAARYAGQPVYFTDFVVRVDAPFRETVGPLVTPRRVLDAVIEGRADVGPLDSYLLDLWRRYQPELVRDLRVIATTAPAPIPRWSRRATSTARRAHGSPPCCSTRAAEQAGYAVLA